MIRYGPRLSLNSIRYDTNAIAYNKGMNEKIRTIIEERKGGFTLSNLDVPELFYQVPSISNNQSNDIEGEICTKQTDPQHVWRQGLPRRPRYR